MRGSVVGTSLVVVVVFEVVSDKLLLAQDLANLEETVQLDGLGREKGGGGLQGFHLK